MPDFIGAVIELEVAFLDTNSSMYDGKAVVSGLPTTGAPHSKNNSNRKDYVT
jgi:hypothetical protein